MNILLTGASGLVGSAFGRIAVAAGHSITGLCSTAGLRFPGFVACLAVDLSDDKATRTSLQTARADVIVNCAAVAAPAACDLDPVRSEALNVTLPHLLAEAAARMGSRLIHLSSEQVYDGTQRTPYSTADACRPINLYGQQKLRSEQAVQATAGARAVIVRPPLLLGNSLSGARSTHESLFVAWRGGNTPALFVDEFRQPCTADDLASVMFALCSREDLSGVFNWAGGELVSRYELGRRIRDHFGLGEHVAPLKPSSRIENSSAARTRPACLALDTAPLCELLHIRRQPLSTQLATLNVPSCGRNLGVYPEGSSPI